MVETLIYLILGLALIGLITFAIIRLVPMPADIQKVVITVATIGCILIAILVLLPLVLGVLPGHLP